MGEKHVKWERNTDGKETYQMEEKHGWERNMLDGRKTHWMVGSCLKRCILEEACVMTKEQKPSKSLV